MTSDERYQRAKQRVNEIKGFYGHFATYGGVIGLLFLIDLLTGGAWWFFWPLFGWGIGIVANYIEALRGKAYTVRLAEKEYQKLKERHP